MAVVIRGIVAAVVVLALGLGLAACGSGGNATSATTIGAAATTEPPPAPGTPASAVVVQVGNTAITRAQYEHWMRIGDATVQKPPATGPLPKPVNYEPPDFTECVAHLRAGTVLHETTSQLKAKCEQTFRGIQERIVRFLIRGYWLRQEAAEDGITVSPAELQSEFNKIKQQEFPTAVSFQRLLTATRQRSSDLMFAVETEMLAAKLQQRSESNSEGGVEVSNRKLVKKWTARTDCQPGYVVIGCKQYR
jgi:hypothetical protein